MQTGDFYTVFINFDRDVECRKHMSEQLAALGLSHERVRGVRGIDLPTELRLQTRRFEKRRQAAAVHRSDLGLFGWLGLSLVNGLNHALKRFGLQRWRIQLVRFC